MSLPLNEDQEAHYKDGCVIAKQRGLVSLTREAYVELNNRVALAVESGSIVDLVETLEDSMNLIRKEDAEPLSQYELGILEGRRQVQDDIDASEKHNAELRALLREYCDCDEITHENIVQTINVHNDGSISIRGL